MWDYSEKVKEHYKNPKNVGEIENPSTIGEAGSLTCGDALKIYLKINEQGIITDAKFQTFGCGSAVASSSMLTEMIIGKTIDEAKKITNKDIADALGGLPPEKMHCSVMGHEALEDALKNYGVKEDIKEEDEQIMCQCFNVTKGDIKKAINDGAKNLSEIADKTGATRGCGRCKDIIQNYINEILGTNKTEEKPQAPTGLAFILQVNKVIENVISSELAKDCGGIEFKDIKGKDVYVKLTGSCKGCCNAHITLKNFVEKELREHVDPEINVYEVE